MKSLKINKKKKKEKTEIFMLCAEEFFKSPLNIDIYPFIYNL